MRLILMSFLVDPVRSDFTLVEGRVDFFKVHHIASILDRVFLAGVVGATSHPVVS